MHIYQSVTSDMLPALDLQVDGCYQHLVICKPDLQPCSSWRGVCVLMYMYNIIVRHAGACTEPKRLTIWAHAGTSLVPSHVAQVYEKHPPPESVYLW